MTYRRYRTASTKPRQIIAKFAGSCRCCGAPIKAGEMVDYYPDLRAIGHVGALDGNSPRCAAVLSNKPVDDFAGAGLDARWEDQCAEICGR